MLLFVVLEIEVKKMNIKETILNELRSKKEFFDNEILLKEQEEYNRNSEISYLINLGKIKAKIELVKELVTFVEGL